MSSHAGDEVEAWVAERALAPEPVFPLLGEMWVERGTRADWDLLAGLHYKMNTTGVGAKYWRLRFRGETIGVCVFTMSRPLLKERHKVFPKLTPGVDTQISNIHRYRFINDRFRVVGRFVVDTMFRSSGAAYRFLNLACRQFGFEFLEIQSSMSKYNWFAHRAGFRFAKPVRSAHYDKGLRFMRRFFEAHPGDQEALMEEYRRMSPALQTMAEREMKAFYFDHSPLEKTGSRRHYSHGVVENWDVRRTISKIQGLCFASPLYGWYPNPDAPDSQAGRDAERLPVSMLPARLPILAFDLQAPQEPLAVDRLDEIVGWTDLDRRIPELGWDRPTVLPEGWQTSQEDLDERQDHAEEVDHR